MRDVRAALPKARVGKLAKKQIDAFLRDVLVGSGGAVVLASLIVYAIDAGHLERPARTGIAFTRDSVHFVVRW